MNIYEEVGKILLKRQNKHCTTKIYWEDLTENTKFGYMEDARVAIEKYRELSGDNE